MEPVINACTHNDHRASFSFKGVVGKFSCSVNHHISINAGEFFLPFRSIRRVIFVGFSAFTAKTAINTIVCKGKIINCRYNITAALTFDFDCRYSASYTAFMVVSEVWQLNFNNIIFETKYRETRINFLTGIAVFLFEIPFVLTIPAIAHSTIRNDEFAGFIINDEVFKLRMLVSPAEVFSIEEAARLIFAILLVENNQEWKISIAFVIIDEKFCGLTVKVFFEDNMSHCHCECCITSGLETDPSICNSCRFSIVRCNRNNFSTFITCFSQEVSVRSTSQWNIGAPSNYVTSIKPVGRLRNISLISPNLRRSRW